MIFIVTIFLCIVIIGLIIYIIKYIQPRLQYNADIELHNKQLEQQHERLMLDISNKTNEFNLLNTAFENSKEQFLEKSKLAADQEFQQYNQQLNKEYDIILTDLMNSVNDQFANITKQQDQLQDLVNKQNAYIQEQLRQEQIQQQADFYKLNLSKADIEDIQLLRNLQLRLMKKEAIDKIIWDLYYKPAYDVLMSHLFTSNDKICGIYKITCLINNKAYIGQSVDIKNRFKEHIRSALEFGTKTNKLYNLMSEVGPEQFTFEILEIVPRIKLNEQEAYWINLYQTKTYGLNKTAGNA